MLISCSQHLYLKHRGQAVPENLLPQTPSLSVPLNVLQLATEPFGRSEMTLESVRRQKIAVLSSDTRDKVNIEKYKIGRNLFLVICRIFSPKFIFYFAHTFKVSLSFLFVISAFQGMQNLQLSVNNEHYLGAISLTTVYMGSVISCLFLPPFLLNRLGCKYTLVVCMSVYSLYMLINFIPRFYSLIPGSLFLGT